MRHLERAIAVARTSTERQKHGAVIAKGNRVVAVGVNANRNIPINCTNPKMEAAIHAEEAAIRALPSDMDTSRLTLYVARIRKGGDIGLSAPCPRCQDAIAKAGIKEVIWT